MTNCVRLLFLFFSPVFLSFASKIYAEGAHVHGLATLALAFEKGVLEIEFESPAANLVGFEHSARTAEEKKIIKQTEKILKAPKSLFSFDGANCEVVKTKVDISSLLDSEKSHDEHHHGHHHDHNDHHEEHDHEAYEKAGKSSENHSEIAVSYRFKCQNSKKINTISTALFRHFPGIEKIEAAWVTESKQGAASLNANKTKLSLR